MKRLVFDNRVWNGKGIGHNEHCWFVADVEPQDDKVGTVTWPDGSVTYGHFLNVMKDVPSAPEQIPCGPTGEDIFCACGCGGDDSRCDYWIHCYENRVPVADDHTCCKTGIPDHVL